MASARDGVLARVTNNSIWIWGRHPVLEALRSGTVQVVLISEAAKAAPIISEIEAAAKACAVPVRRVPTAEVERHAEGQPAQGVVGEVRLPHRHTIESLLEPSSVSGS